MTACQYRRLLHASVLFSLIVVSAEAKDASRSDGKPTSQVVVQYNDLVSSGAMLTPAGWEKATALFTKATPFPDSIEIIVKSTGGVIREVSNHDNRARVEETSTDLFGTIDSNLRFKPESPFSLLMVFIYNLAYIDQSWKITSNFNHRTVTPEQAIQYVTEMRDKTTDPSVKANADKTIKTLQKMKTRCRHPNWC